MREEKGLLLREDAAIARDERKAQVVFKEHALQI